MQLIRMDLKLSALRLKTKHREMVMIERKIYAYREVNNTEDEINDVIREYTSNYKGFNVKSMTPIFSDIQQPRMGVLFEREEHLK